MRATQGKSESGTQVMGEKRETQGFGGKQRRREKGKKRKKKRKKERGKERKKERKEKKERREGGMMAGDRRRRPELTGVGRRRWPKLQA